MGPSGQFSGGVQKVTVESHVGSRRVEGCAGRDGGGCEYCVP